MNHTDVLIVGAGPAGMSAAIAAKRHGLSVTVLDDQITPGGQIWRSIETAGRRFDILGPSYSDGRAIAEAFRDSGATYEAGVRLWQLERGFRAFYSRDDEAHAIEASTVILATGAQERPVPFSGWTLPGVLTVGAAQILLKAAGEIPDKPVWIAGSGPLPLLYCFQLLRAGGRVAGYLDTTPRGQWRSAIRYLPGALRAWTDLLKGFSWRVALRRSGVPVISGAHELEAVGGDRLEELRYRMSDGASVSVATEMLLVHEGVVPHIHAALSLGCEIQWNALQDSYAPVVDEWGETSVSGLFVAGDGAGIAGAKAALFRGELAGFGAAIKLGRSTSAAAEHAARSVRRKLGRELALRPFLDAMFRPRREIFVPQDATIVCRCEEITARQVRDLAHIGRPGPSQMKVATRAGMGPCQGRQCGYTITRLLADAQKRPPEDVGYFNIRPPLKPVTVGELAALSAELKD